MQLELKCYSQKVVKTIKSSRGVIRAESNICDGARLSGNRLLTINYFCKQLNHRCLIDLKC